MDVGVSLRKNNQSYSTDGCKVIRAVDDNTMKGVDEHSNNKVDTVKAVYK